MAWLVIRAHVQSMSLDEADTYLVWAARQDPSHWFAASNNHVLNSLLMRLTTSVFGAYHLTVRMPALIGAAFYLSGTVALAMTLHRAIASRLALFSLLALNPMTQDYLVAARGYALASGFLVWALWLILRVDGVNTPRRAAALSAYTALSFASNFAFAWVCFAVFLVAVVQARRGGARTWIALTVPAAAIFVVFCSYPALTMPRQQLFFGTKSMGRMFGSVMESFTSTPNPYLANPWLLVVLKAVRVYLVPAMLAGLAGTLILLIATRTRARSVSLCLGVLAMAVASHYTMHRIAGMPLPKERTAIFLVPLCILLFSTAASVAFRSRFAYRWQASFRAVLAATAIYVLFCMRLTWFAEWPWDADTRAMHDVAAWWADRLHERTIASGWQYTSAMNFYEATFAGHGLTFRHHENYKHSRGPALWLLNWDFDQDVIAERGLRVVWRADGSGSLIAVDPQTVLSV